MKNIETLVKELCKLPHETTWVEFKHNNYIPNLIGERISALANSAALEDRQTAYMIWGVHDKTHEIVGTDKDLQNIPVNNGELEGWLRQRLSRNSDFNFDSAVIDGKRVGVLSITAASGYPVMFQNEEYIRFGSITRKLNEFVEKRGQLWDKLRNSRFETRPAKSNLTSGDVVALLDCQLYFDQKGIPFPTSQDGILHYFVEEEMVRRQDDGLFTITNLGAILFAKRLADFPSVSRKAVRVVKYAGNNKMEIEIEETNPKGYAVGYEDVVKYICALTPSSEKISLARREQKRAYPVIAIREAVANALIHQDLNVSGAGPLVEIFSNRIEITNPGSLLVDINRIVDNPPMSRNEKLAALMRQLKMCEEAGSGWDKIVLSSELMFLPAPTIAVFDESTRVSLFTMIPFKNLEPDSKLWSCYMHACIKHIQQEQLTNASLRQRFDLPESSSGMISRLIKEAVKKRLIRAFDPSTAPRYMKYVPVWA